ncbi:MAG: TlpA disulfide reductase family protein [Desulfobacteraceae bacterium]|jgi:thiol-disulfide isomerase/thioredoxin
MSVSILKPVGAILVALIIFGLAGCRPKSPTLNPVKSVELAEFDRMIHNEAFSGLVAVIASWCPPCREELPELAKLDRHYRDKGIQIVALSIDKDGAKSVQQLINESKVDFPVYWVGSQGIAHYKIIGVPTLMIVRNGQLMEIRPGIQSRQSIEQHIKSLISDMAQKSAS